MRYAGGVNPGGEWSIRPQVLDQHNDQHLQAQSDSFGPPLAAGLLCGPMGSDLSHAHRLGSDKAPRL